MKVHFERAMEELHGQLAQISAMVEKAVNQAAAAVATRDEVSAQQIIAGDRIIDDGEIRIEEECLKILALYQPLAGDLRQVITILKVNNELERVGDLAVNMAERVVAMAEYRGQEFQPLDFSDMARRSCAMLRDALDALAYHDVPKAEQVLLADEAVDQLHRLSYDLVLRAVQENAQQANYHLNGLTVSRCLERIGDIATNIAEDVIYLECGKIVRHQHE